MGTTRTLPRVLTPVEVDALTRVLRTHRDRAMVAAMLLGGLRRCEVVGLHLADLHVAEKRVFVADGKGGHQRLVPVSSRFFDHVRSYLDAERPADAGTQRLFVVLKRPRRGQPLTPPAWTRCSTEHGAGPGWSRPPATSCGTPA